jgi:tetraacyldisaccharide 4'-kinase
MNPLSAIFGAGVALRNELYDRGVFKTRKLSRPVVSVGNISLGGTGKTPFVIALGQLLKARGIAFDVLSRGYGRRSVETAVVDPNGTPEHFGDEPLLIARKLDAPVIVGADRHRTGLLAEQKYASKLHLLDDGFQHRRLHRDFDIVMAPASDLEDTLLPIGRLREPLSSLWRADVVVSDRGESAPEIASFVLGRSARSLNAVMQGEKPPATPSLHVLPVEIWRMKRNVYLEETSQKPLAFCGIARPRQFFGHLQELGIELAGAVSFSDHHRYNENDLARLLRAKSSTGADGFITTEKDAINLGTLADRLQPLRIAQLRLILEDPEQALGTLLSTLERRCGCRF